MQKLLNFKSIKHFGTRCVSTSKFFLEFNTRPSKKIHFSKNPVGLFGISELRGFEGFYLLKERCISRTDDLIAEAISQKRDRKIVEIFDELSDTLCKVADLSEFIRLSHPQANYSHAAEDACISISGIVEKLNTHRELFQSLKGVVDHGDKFPTTDIDNHVAKLFLFDFEQCGIHLEEEERKKVVHLNECILYLGQRFMSGAVNARSLNKNILPENIRHLFSIDGDKILVSGLYADSPNSLAREAAYRLYLYPDPHQEELLTDLINSRHELATTCGFPTYAHRALNSSTMETPENVKEFLEILSEKLRPRAQKDFDIMQKMKLSDGGLNSPLCAWDTPYFTSRMKNKYLQISSQATEFMPFFSLGGCMEGFNNLMKSLFGIRLENTEMDKGESWADDVYKLCVIDENNTLLGHIYCDFFERTGKPNQDCHFTIQGGKRLANGEYQNPIVVVMLNFSLGRWNPPLLTPSMVDNLFHELGHAMHSMLARTEYQHVTGTRCSTDFAEVPSVLMEYFASDPRVLKTFARHYQTQEPMPDEMLRRLCASKNVFSASETQLQVFYSALDQVYHGLPETHRQNTTETLKMVQEQHYGLPYVPQTAWQLRFSHLVGYGAKYYSYLCSRAIASWIWQEYFQKDPLNREQGEKYRYNCLLYGGAVPSRQLVSNFLGKEISAQNLANNLINEIDEHQANMKI
ncbi:hypothetical protein ACKWTF_004765 [Chironomus riparius]